MDSEESGLGSRGQETSPSAGENTNVGLEPCYENVLLQLFQMIWIFAMTLDVICFSKRIHNENKEITSGISASFTHNLDF